VSRALVLTLGAALIEVVGGVPPAHSPLQETPTIRKIKSAAGSFLLVIKKRRRLLLIPIGVYTWIVML